MTDGYSALTAAVDATGNPQAVPASYDRHDRS